MAYEQIDKAKENSSAFDSICSSIVDYMLLEEPDVDVRLKIERALSKYAAKSSPDWLLNMILYTNECYLERTRQAEGTEAGPKQA